MAASCGRQVEGLRRFGIWVDVIAFTSRESRMTMQINHRDGGTDYILSRRVRQGLTAQQAWSIVLSENIRLPYTYVVGFGANHPGHMAVTFAAWLGLASLVQVRGNDFDRDWFEPGRGAWVREALSRASVVGAVAPDLVKRIKSLFPASDVRFIPNGVDVDAWELLPGDAALRDETRSELVDNGRRIIGIFGELKFKKGIPFWLGALRDTGLMDQVALLIVGKIMDEETEQILDDPALAPPSLKVSFTNRDKLPGLYAACDFITLPSWIEGMPNVLLEAMSLGVAPIVSDAGAMGDMVKDGDTGFVFPVGDRRAAASATARALRLDDGERAAMGTRAREFVSRVFSIEKEAEALREIVAPVGDLK